MRLLFVVVGDLDSRAGGSLRARGERLSSRRLPSRPLTSSSVTTTHPQRTTFPWLASFTILSFILAAVFYWLAPSFLRSFSPNPQPQFKPVHNEVTYGSVVKLMHERTQYRLHSHEIPYGSGSGQQSVTGFGGVDDANSYWVVREAKDSPLLQGDMIPHGAVIRLQHMQTRRWLHSHLHQSPITGNLEVSCFGGEGESDSGDLWILEIDRKDGVWTRDQKVRFQHIDTGAYLHSHDKKYSRIAGGQQEVCGMRKKTADNVWIAAEGVYLLPGQKATEMEGSREKEIRIASPPGEANWHQEGSRWTCTLSSSTTFQLCPWPRSMYSSWNSALRSPAPTTSSLGNPAPITASRLPSRVRLCSKYTQGIPYRRT
ncbi:hypothetical protein GOP47_0009582 [Adiantum capillus-veneris]|uniref:MIR domain-containing protein n=1 Tax=Adiantum capillus-veneris TaxID=13818 RepID=A0A9D4ZJM6_ADICA|nr:hypothetical protein GOP47_0009582 [Adiantum capillus-veneris]